MLLTLTDFIKLNIYEIKINKRTILLNNIEFINGIEFILLTSSNMEYKLKFYDIYENLILTISLISSSIIEYNESKINIKTKQYKLHH